MKGILLNEQGGTKSPPVIFCNTGESITPQSYNYIPIDFGKYKVLGCDSSIFLNNPRLKFTRKLDEGTGEIQTNEPRLAEYQGLTIRIYDSGSIYLQGSLHKFYNNGLHNHNDYSKSRFSESITRLYNELGIKPSNLYIIQLEFGFNLNLPNHIAPNTLLDRCFQHKGKMLEVVIHNSGNFRQAIHDTYVLKLYNKGLQYGLNGNLIRLEIKQTNWSEYRRCGIVTLQDFSESLKRNFLDKLVSRWGEVVFYDPTIQNQPKWGKYQNPLFWDELRMNKSNKTFKKHLDRLRLLNRSSGGNYQDYIKQELFKKAYELNRG